MTDRELLYRFAQTGSGDDFSELVRRHADSMYTVCVHVLGDRAAAEDATQAAFLVLAKKARTAASSAVVADWLTATARNCALNMKKAAVRRKSIEKDAAAMKQDPLHHEVLPSETLSSLNDAIAALPPQQRSAVTLRYLQNRSQAETAVEMKCAEHSVSAALSKALDRLRESLSRAGVTLSAGALTHSLAHDVCLQAPPQLVLSATAVATGQATASLAATQAAKAVLNSFVWFKVKLAAAALLLALCATVTLSAERDKPAAGPQDAPSPAVAPNDDKDRLVLAAGHSGYDIEAASSADGRLMATWDAYGRELRIWDARTHQVLLAEESRAAAVAFAPDGKSFVTLSSTEKNALQHRAWPSGRILRTIDVRGINQIDSVVRFVLDGTHIVANTGSCTAGVWNLETGECVFLEATDPAIEAERKAIEKRLADIPRAEVEARLVKELGKPATKEQREAFFKAYREKIASFIPADEIQKLEKRRMELLLQANHNVKICPVLGGTAVATLPDDPMHLHPIRICDASTGKFIRACERVGTFEVSQQKQSPATIIATSDGKFLIEGRSFSHGVDFTSLITIWDAATGMVVASKSFNAKDNITGLNSKGGMLALNHSRTLLLAGDAAMLRWDWEKGPELQRFATPDKYSRLMLVDGDDTRIMSRSLVERRSAKVWSSTLPDFKFEALPISTVDYASDAIAVGVTSGGQMLATSGADCSVALWDLLEARLVDRFNFGQPANGHSGRNWTRFTPDNQKLMLVSGRTHYGDASWDVGVRTREPSQLERLVSVASKETDPVNGRAASLLDIRFTENMALLPERSALRRFDLATRNELQPFQLPKRDDSIDMMSLCLPAKGKHAYIVHGNWPTASLKRMDLSNGELTPLLDGEFILDCAVSDDQKFMLVKRDLKEAGALGAKHVMELRSLPELAIIATFADGWDPQFDATSRRFAYILPTHEVFVGEIQPPANAGAAPTARNIALLPKERYSATRGWSHGDSHNDVQLLPGGKGILYGQATGTLLVDVDSGKDVARFSAFSDGKWIISTADGLFTGSPDMESRLSIVAKGEVLPATHLADRRKPDEIKKRLRNFIIDPTPLGWTGGTKNLSKPPTQPAQPPRAEPAGDF